LAHGNVSQGFLRNSQFKPKNPVAQEQLYDNGVELHVALFLQGFDKHGCTSFSQLTPVVPGKHVLHVGPVKFPEHSPFKKKKKQFLPLLVDRYYILHVKLQ
jgi:hypothetical protein